MRNPDRQRQNAAALLLLLAMLLAGCGGPQAPDLTGAQSVLIKNEWAGMWPVSPLAAHYELRPEAGQFLGTADFSVAGGQQTAGAEIAVPADVMQAFLETLARSPMKEGEYVPRVERTDDFPLITIDIDLGSETVAFFSTSQGGSHVPWGAAFGGKTYVIDADTPARALKLLEPYLQAELLDALVEQHK
jgi:hypothetical protein